MKKELSVGFFTGEKVGESEINILADTDVAIFVVKEFASVNVRNELEGKSELLLGMGRISKRIGGVTVFSAVTDTYGLSRHSAVAFSAGKLSFIADENTRKDRYFSPSYGLKTVSVRGARLGVLVGGDCVETEFINAHCLMGCDAIIDLSADVLNFDSEKLFNSLSYIFAIPTVSVGYVKKIVSTADGDTVYSGKDAIRKCVLPLEKRFIEVKRKLRR